MRSYRKIILAFLLLLYSLFSINASINVGARYNNIDSLYVEAREWAFTDSIEKAQALCKQILFENPNHFDAKVLLARLYGWQGKNDSAIVLLDQVLQDVPDHYDGLLARTDIALWQNNLDDGLVFANAGLVYFPNDAEFLDRLNKMKGIAIQDSVLSVKADSLQKDSASLINTSYKNALCFDYYFDYFKNPYTRRWHMFSTAYSRRLQSWLLVGRLSVGQIVLDNEHLFDNLGVQFEVDAYKTFKNNDYAYLNYGIGFNDFFPHHRFGAEYFKALPAKFEASLGFRYLVFDDDIFILTASISKYIPHFWFSLRGYFSPSEAENLYSLFFTTRYYIDPLSSYLYLILGTGDSPDQPAYLVSSFGRFSSQSVRFGINKNIHRFVLKAGAGYSYEGYSANLSRNRFEINLGACYGF